MKLANEPLSKHTTFRIGGPAEVLSIPNTIEELIEDIVYCKKNSIKYRILGNGSNVLVDNSGVKGYVIKITRCCNSIELMAGNRVKVGGGVLLGLFIKFCIEHDLYGNEFLSSVPGTIGGAIFMNAGTWTDKNKFISDYLVSVKIFDGFEIRELDKEECLFGYRSSIFHKRENWVILDALFELPLQSRQLGEIKRKQRLEYASRSQDLRYPNAGSVFCQCNGKLLRLLKGICWGGAGWSSKTLNWINIYTKGSSDDIYNLIRIGRLVHFIFFQKIKIEIRIWK